MLNKVRLVAWDQAVSLGKRCRLDRGRVVVAKPDPLLGVRGGVLSLRLRALSEC